MRILKVLVPMFSLVLGGFLLGNFNIPAEAKSGNLVITRFPAEVGNSWDYRRTFYMVVFDTASGDTIEEHLMVDSLHCEFIKIDTLHGWECYKYASTLFEVGHTYSDTVWYSHPDTAFLEIAYSPPTNAGPPWKSSGKTRVKLGERWFNSIEELKVYLYQMRNSRFASTSPETTFWEPPKKLFIFPLKEETQWISTIDPWVERREVVKEEITNVPAGSFLTLKIEMKPEGEDFLLYQWLSEAGVIKDSAYFDTSLATDEFGNIIGYILVYDKYELVDLGLTAVEDENSENKRPVDFSLSQNYPNPFNPTTAIRFSLSVEHSIATSLELHNVLGQKVRTLVDEPKGAGSYEVIWDGRDDKGKEVASGIYFYRLKAGGGTECKKMLLLR